MQAKMPVGDIQTDGEICLYRSPCLLQALVLVHVLPLQEGGTEGGRIKGGRKGVREGGKREGEREEGLEGRRREKGGST